VPLQRGSEGVGRAKSPKKVSRPSPGRDHHRRRFHLAKDVRAIHMVSPVVPGSLVYDDASHVYRDGKRLTNVSSLPKIVADHFKLDAYNLRTTVEALVKDPELFERVGAAIGAGNRDQLDRELEAGKRAAGVFDKAERGSLMHFVLLLVLQGRTDLILTKRQREDADALQRTLDRYRLTPTSWAENFVVYPGLVAGRFDAVLLRPDGTPIMCDLKSGKNAVRYPQSVAIQLSAYAHAPFMAASVTTQGDISTVTEWVSLPKNLDLVTGYVLQLEPSEPVGALYEINIEHGWKGAQLALKILNWRKEFNYGRELAREVQLSFADRALATADLDELRAVWKEARRSKAHTTEFLDAVERRREQFAATPN
jgi:hypothetical protein